MRCICGVKLKVSVIGPHCLNLIKGQSAGAVGRVLGCKEDLADGEIGVRESDDGVARLNIDGRPPAR